jgi:pseudoazurin
VKELNRGPAGFFVFAPELVRIKPGDTIDFLASDRGHDVHSVSGMIPDGAQPIDGKTNEDTKVTLSQPGVYVIACKGAHAYGHGRRRGRGRSREHR